ncbi:MAG TPA: glycosyltransferase [Chitinophagaceae bacterium]|nr:glycosyltransferase [Chitinophagaceae bacterium]
MITDRNILCISTPPWEANYASTTVQLMRELAKHNKVLFVNNPFTIKDVTDGLQRKKEVPVKKVFGLKERLKIVPLGNGRDVYVLTPPMIFSIQFLSKGFLYRSLMKLNGLLVRRSVKKYLQKLQMNQDLIQVVSFNPTIGLETGRQFNERLLLYLCYDEIEAAPHLKKHGVWQEKAFGKLADATIVTSQGLYNRKKDLSPHCYIVKNAADFPLFSTGFNPQIPAIKSVGFIGGIDRRLDYDLLQNLISSLPHVEFNFIGRTVMKEGEHLLRQFKNVIISGPKNVHELPSYVKDFSVGIIPFRKTEFLKTVYPLKINEYLAAGIPVVTTHFSYLDDFKPVVRIAENETEFLNFVTDEMQYDSIEKKRARQNFARQNSWEHRAEEFSNIITELEHKTKL